MSPGVRGAGVSRRKVASQASAGAFCALMHQLGPDDGCERHQLNPGSLGFREAQRAQGPATGRTTVSRVPRGAGGAASSRSQLRGLGAPRSRWSRRGQARARVLGVLRAGPGGGGAGRAGRGSGSSLRPRAHSAGAALGGGRLSEAARPVVALLIQHGFRQFPPHPAVIHLREEKVP